MNEQTFLPERARWISLLAKAPAEILCTESTVEATLIQTRHRIGSRESFLDEIIVDERGGREYVCSDPDFCRRACSTSCASWYPSCTWRQSSSPMIIAARDRGEIAQDLCADFLRVRIVKDIPIVLGVWKKGRQIA